MKTCLGILRRMLLLFAVCAAPAVAAEFDAEEQNRLGDMYFNGSGEQAPNYALALKHYNNVAGRGPAQAFAWFSRAAGQGLAEAQSALGDLYKHGLGVSQDAAQAEYWYAQAGVGGSENEPANPAPGTVRQAGTSSTHFGDKIVTDDSGTTTYYPFDHGSRDDDHPHLSKIVVHPSGERTYYDTYGNSMAKGGMTSFGYVLQTAGEEQEMLNLMDSMTPEEILDIWADRITGE